MTLYLKRFLLNGLLFVIASLFASAANAQAVRGVAGDLWADLVLGQPNFGSLSYNQVTASGIFIAGGVAADPNPSHHRLYVWDSGNSRILGFSDTTVFTPNQAANQLGFTADIVLGQPNFTSSGCNGDSNDQVWPNYVPPTQTSLCGMWQRQGSISEGGSWAAMAVDPATGDLYVGDVFNNRILRFTYASLTSGAEGVPAAGVWGQPDYASFINNQGLSSPTDYTLWFGGAPSAALTTSCTDDYGSESSGVGFDSQHNLWVADVSNNRVLRFPAGGGGMPQTIADLVLGQGGFNTNGTANLTSPIAVRIDSYGNVYVLDFGIGSGRLLVFNAATFSGLSADPTPDVIYTTTIKTGLGMDMDSSNNLWVANNGVGGGPGQGNVVELQPQYSGNSATGFTPTNALNQDTIPPAAPTGSNGESGPNFNFADGSSIFSAFVVTETVAVDGNGDLYVFGKGNIGNVFRFPAPIPAITAGKSYSADVDVFKQPQQSVGNQIGWNGINQVFGVAVGQDNSQPQLIVADSFRLDYWNLPPGGLVPGQTAITNGQAPDGYAGVNSTSVTMPSGNSFTRMRVDRSTGATGTQHLWVINNEQTAQLYNLPLSNYATYSSTFNTNIPVLGAPTSLVDWSGIGGLSGLNDLMPCASVSAPYASGPVSYLWVADNYHSRVFRVRDPLGKLGLGPVVDILIGQTTASNNTCSNFGTISGGGCTGSISPINQYMLNWPGSITLDHAGNLYVCDFSLETAGNWRLLEYDESEIAQATQNSLTSGQIQFLSNSGSYSGATHIYDESGHFNDGGCSYDAPPASNPTAYICMPLQAAFPSDDRAMVVGDFEKYPEVVPAPHANFDPTNPAEPWNHLNDFYSNMYSSTFDEQDNLYTVDNNRARVLVYYNPIPTISSTPTATPSSTATSTFTSTPTATLTSTVTATPTPTTSSTPTNTGTPTPSSTPTNSPTITPTYTVTSTPTEACHEPKFYPNPAKSGDSISLHLSPCDQGQDVHVRVFTLAFRKVRDKEWPQTPVGTDPTLELKDDWGMPLANGLYYVVIDRPEGRTIGKLLVLR